MSFQSLRQAAIPLFNLAYHAGFYRLVSSFLAGRGVIFSMHRFAEPGQPTLHPGHVLHTDTLANILTEVRLLGWQIVSIDEVWRRLSMERNRSEGSGGGRFACFTCDDGFADNLTLALPVFRKHQAPLCVYITTGQIERSIFYWLGANEELILKTDRIDLPSMPCTRSATLVTMTFEQKKAAYHELDRLCHTLGGSFFPVLHNLYQQHGVDWKRNFDRLALTLDQARELASDPLVTIGCHTVNHQRLSLMDEAAAYHEMDHGRRTLEDWMSVEVRHLAYPFGKGDACGPREFALAKRAGFKTAVTTRPGNIFPEHAKHLHCLPRRSIPSNLFDLRTTMFGVETIIRRQPKVQTD